MTTDAAAFAQLTAISGLATLAWYAMPDLIGSRALRGVLKAGLLGGWWAGLAAGTVAVALREGAPGS